MDIQQLEALIEISKYNNNFKAAAQKMHLTQPAVSARISNLEKELCIDLFYRSGKNIYLTEYGKILIPFAEKILELVHNAKKTVENTKENEANKLNILTTSRIGTYVLPYILDDFILKHPDVEISLTTERSSATVFEMIENGADNIGLLNTTVNNPLYEFIPLGKDRVILVSSPNHPLYKYYDKHQVVPKEELHQTVMIGFTDRSNYYQPLIDDLHNSGIFPKQSITVDNIEAMKKLIISKIGVAFLPRSAVIEELMKGKVVEVPFYQKVGLIRETVMVYKKHKYMNPIVTDFKKSAQDVTSIILNST